MGEFLKQDFVGFPDLEAAFEAVKGMIFGPADPGYIKHKFNEIVREKKLERERESNPLSPLHGREETKERETRIRGDREFQRLAVMALLNDEQQHRLGAIYDGLDGSRDKGAEIGRRLEDLDDKLNRWHEQILANAAYKDGKAYFQYEDGRVIDEDGNDVPAERVAGVDFTGKTRAEEKAAYDATRTEVDDLKQGLSNAIGDLDTLEQDLNRRIAENPDKADEAMEEVEAKIPGIDKRIDDIDQRVKEIDKLPRMRTEKSALIDIEPAVAIETKPDAGGMAVLKLP